MSFLELVIGMLTSVRIQNFRQFRDLELSGLAQINLITGKNDTGKTSLLEALFLLDGPTDPSRTVVLANFRGVPGFRPQTPELWEWLFANGARDSQVHISAVDSSGGETRLTLSLAYGGLIPAITNGKARRDEAGSPYVTATSALPALTYEYLSGSGDRVSTALRWTNEEPALDSDRVDSSRQGFFLPEGHRAGESKARRLSRLLLNGREPALIDALRVVEPRLTRLSVLDLDGRASIYADLGGVPLVPLAMMGAGFGRLRTIVAAILLEESSIYLVDEIDAGLHYSVMPDVWRTIVEAAVAHDAQIFATTHSYECIEAAVKGSDRHEGSLAFYRLDRREGGIDVVAGEDNRLRSAIRIGAEIR